MEPLQNTVEQNPSLVDQPEKQARANAGKTSFAAKLSGYDIFISFALGPPPRGTHSYASDLARRLRELDYTVFFSEDEAPVGSQLDSTLRKALLRSHAMVVVANRDMLEDPRWVRTEVLEFKKAHPRRPVIPVFIEEVHKEAALITKVREWLPHEGNIWVDESATAVANGIASEEVVNRLATAPRFWRANRRWRIVVSVVWIALVGLTIWATVANINLSTAIRVQTALRLNAEAQAILTKARGGGPTLGILKTLAAHRIASHREIEDAILSQVVTYEFVEKIVEADTHVRAVAFSPNGTRLVSGGTDGILRFWDSQTRQLLGAQLKGHEGPVTSLAYSPDGHYLVSGSTDQTLRLWDVQIGQPVGAPLKEHKGFVTSVAFSPDGHRVASASDDQTVQLWDAKSGNILWPQSNSRKREMTDLLAGLQVGFSPDGTRLVVGGYKDGTLQLLDVETGQTVGAPLKGHEGPVLRVAFSPDGHQLVSGSSDRSLRIWDVKTGQAIGEPLKGHKDAVTSVVFSPDGHRLVSGSSDRTLRIWDVKTGQALGGPVEEHTDTVTSVAFNPDGTLFVSGSWDGALYFRTAPSKRLLGAPLKGHTSSVTSVAFSPDGRHLASGSLDKTLRLWNAQTKEPLVALLGGHSQGVTSLAFSPDGTRLVSGSTDQTLRLWDVRTGRPLSNPLLMHKDGVLSVAYSPDGRRLASGDMAHELYLWDAQTEHLIRTLTDRRGTGVVPSVAFSPDGTRLVSGSGDGMLQVWDVETGLPIGEPLRGHKGQVRSVAFSPDGTKVVSGSGDGTVRLWPAPKVWPDLLCAKLTRNLSRKEWREQVSSDIDYIEQCPGLPIPSDEAEQQSPSGSG